MRLTRLPVLSALLLAFGLLLSACGPAKVNLYAVANSFDHVKAGADQYQTQYDDRSAQLTEILLNTSTPGVAPYPNLRGELSSMATAIQGMRAADAKVDAFKPKFQAYAQGKSIVSEDDQAGWAEYQGVMAEYNAILGEINYQASLFNSANTRYGKLLLAYGVQKVDAQALREQSEAMRSEVTQGVADMQQQWLTDRKALQLAHGAHGDPEILKGHEAALGQMEKMLPGLKLLQGSVEATRGHAAKKRSAPNGVFWVGPGMKVGSLEHFDDLRKVQDQYRQSRKAWDALAADFDAAEAPGHAEDPPHGEEHKHD